MNFLNGNNSKLSSKIQIFHNHVPKGYQENFSALRDKRFWLKRIVKNPFLILNFLGIKSQNFPKHQMLALQVYWGAFQEAATCAVHLLFSVIKLYCEIILYNVGIWSNIGFDRILKEPSFNFDTFKYVLELTASK